MANSTLVRTPSEVQFPALFKVIFAGPLTVDISSAATGSGTSGTGTATVSGAAVGDIVLVSNPAGAYTAGAPVVGDVSAANTVRLTTINNSAATVDYASTSYTVIVLRPNF